VLLLLLAYCDFRGKLDVDNLLRLDQSRRVCIRGTLRNVERRVLPSFYKV
jgi:hypothetical protein